MSVGEICVNVGDSDFRMLPSKHLRTIKGKVDKSINRSVTFDFWAHKPYSVVGGKFKSRRVSNNYFCELRPMDFANGTDVTYEFDKMHERIQKIIENRVEEPKKQITKAKTRNSKQK